MQTSIMTPEEFKSIGQRFWGKRWKEKMAAFLQRNRSSIYRYCDGSSPVGGFISNSLRSIDKNFKETGQLPKFDINSENNID